MENKPFTLEDLSNKIDTRMDNLSTKIDTSIEDLARMTKNGFDRLSEDFENISGRLGGLEIGQKSLQADVSRIDLRLGYHAPQFEVEELKKRVTKLEEKTGIA
jgi:predicted  nucleic acid-binding Zn-ribbon protein